MLLATYLNDHLAGATAARELARRSASSNRGSALGEFLSGLAEEIGEDREALLAVMAELRIGVNRMKVLGGWTIEKLGRLKPNDRVLSYSPLSPLLELEGLLLGVHAKLALWLALERIAADEPALGAVDLAGLAARAERQLAALEPHRLAIVNEALAR